MRRNFNRALWVVSIILGALFILIPISFSETEIKVSGQVRVRSEVEKKTFVGLDTLINDWTEMRARLGVTATVDSNLTAFIQIQDSKVFGADGTSGITTGSDNVDLHQAYIQIDRLWKNGIGIKAGRFGFNLGNERIFGAADWDSIGRSWEGVVIENGYFDIDFTAFLFDRVAQNENHQYRKHFINGLQMDISRINSQFLIFYERDTNYYVQATTWVRLNRYNLCTYSNHCFSRFYFKFNAAYQFGDITFGFLQESILHKKDISAYMFTIETGMASVSLYNALIAGGIDFASGDTESFDMDRHFITPYYSEHKFRGYMDYFVSSSYYGLVDLYLKGKIDPIRGWTTACDIHYFTAAADYTDFRGGRTKDIGAEIDFTVNTSRISGVGLQAGASIFFPTESYAARVHPRPGLWGYTMLTADF